MSTDIKPGQKVRRIGDSSKVKAGDTVTVTDGIATISAVVDSVRERAAQLWFRFRFGEQPDAYYEVPMALARGEEAFTLTDHQPAPEPEPTYEPRKVYEHPNGDRFWSVNTEHGVMLVNEYGDTDRPSDMTEPLRPLVVIDPAEVDVEALVTTFVEAVRNSQRGGPVDGVLAILAALGIEAS